MKLVTMPNGKRKPLYKVKHLLQCGNCMGLGYVRVSVNGTTQLIPCSKCDGAFTRFTQERGVAGTATGRVKKGLAGNGEVCQCAI